METYQPDADISLDRTIIYFGATWCGPCKRALPVYEEFAENNTEGFEVDFYYVDVDTFSTHSKELDKHFKTVKSIPEVLLFLNGKLIDRLSPWNEDKLYKMMHEYYVEGEEVDNSRYAVIPDRVPYQPELSSSEEDDDELDMPVCNEDGCVVVELPDFSVLKLDTE